MSTDINENDTERVKYVVIDYNILMIDEEGNLVIPKIKGKYGQNKFKRLLTEKKVIKRNPFILFIYGSQYLFLPYTFKLLSWCT